MTRPRGGGRWDSDFLTELFRSPLDPGYAAATKRRQSRPPARWQRGVDRGLTLVVLVVAGVLLAVAYQQVVREEPTRSQVRAELVEQIQQRDATTSELESRREQLRGQVTALRDREIGGEQARRLWQLEASAGLTSVRGEGVVVRVGDGTEQADPLTGAPAPEARILDYDLQRIANALWAHGAEAVAVNGRRLTSTSTIRNASGAILVNRLPVVGPYEVAAIGPDDLADRFRASTTSQYLQGLVAEFGITFEVGTERELTLPAAVAPDLLHAVPSASASPSSGGD